MTPLSPPAMDARVPYVPPSSVVPPADEVPLVVSVPPLVLVAVSSVVLLAVVVSVLVVAVVRRVRARRRGAVPGVSFVGAGADLVVLDEDGTTAAPPPARPGRSREEIMDTVRTTAAPLVLGGAVLWLVFDGMEAFARESMGLLPPLSFAVILAFEFVALWLAWERFARAQKGRPDVPGLALGTWALLAMAMAFQYDHAQHAEPPLSDLGTLARVALPAILGGVVEWALHSRRSTVKVKKDEGNGRLFDSSLRSNPWLYVRARYALAAHPDWTAPQAVQHVRTQDAKALALRLRALISHPPAAPAAPAEIPDPPAPAPVADPVMPELPAFADDKTMERAAQVHERALARAEDIRRRRQQDHEAARSRVEAARRRNARDHERALARHDRAARRHEAQVSRVRENLVRALDALGFVGAPTDTPAADMLRALQMGVLVDDMVGLDYSNPDEARVFFAGLITGDDLEGARALSSTPGVDEVPVPASTPPADGVDVHTASTHPSTSGPADRVDEAPAGVDHRVDKAPADEVPARPATPLAGVRSTPDEAPRVDEVDEVPADGADGVDVHMDGVWTPAAVHTPAPAPVRDEVPTGVDEGPLWPAPAPAPAPAFATDGDDEGPDDDGDGPRGGGAPAPTAAGVLPGQITVEDALAQVAAPSALDVARVGLDAPTWDEATTTKDKVLALLWEVNGNVAAARTVYADRTGEEFPRDAYRRPRPGKSGGALWVWHYKVTSYLISHYGNADTVRATLSAAGVDHTHEAVTAALDEWSATNSDKVLQFRPTRAGS